MALKPDVSLGVALATGTLVYAIYQNATPTLADIRTADQYNSDISTARKGATWTAAAVVAGISLVSKDPGPFVLGGAMVIALDWFHRHADAVNPLTGLASHIDMSLSDVVPPQTQQEQPSDYGYAGDMVAA